ncbi:MAG TPA: putative N-acetylmannosamine-6-phosphate 2-epimerase [Candidatus Baltobacteraceae bacterium]|nr:putative N-acetylmannosamine-6-phosphate 2-epimerase [Candidatus Baltobacteraceae bacterium]
MNVLERLRGGLIVSVQAWGGSRIDHPKVLVAMAAAAEANGAVAVRMQGEANLRAARRSLAVPIIGLVKRDYQGFRPYITPTLLEVGEVLATRADIVAIDATGLPHPGGVTVAELIEAIHDAGKAAMADCATLADAHVALAARADIVATTLCGYTPETEGQELPALGLVAELAKLGTFVIAEGGIHRPAGMTQAFAAGADAVVVGTAITNTDWLVREFAARAAKDIHR